MTAAPLSPLSKPQLLKPRLEILISWSFLISLAVLGLNDWVLKEAYPGVISGKLSDLAGILALQLFLFALFGERRWVSFGIILFFAWWKLPLSQPFINLWNTSGFPPIGRVVDWTDLFALFMLPIGHYLAKRIPLTWHSLRLEHITAGIAALLLFCATSSQRYDHYKIDYFFKTDVLSLKNAMIPIAEPRAISGTQGEFNITLHTDSARTVWDGEVQIVSNGKESRIRLLRLDLGVDVDFFEAQVIQKLPNYLRKEERFFYRDKGFGTLVAIGFTGLSLIPLSIGFLLRRNTPKSNGWRTTSNVLKNTMFVLAITGLILALLAIISNFHVGGPA